MTKQPFKYRRKFSERTIPQTYPDDLPDKAQLAEMVRYVGSSEHKRYPSFAGPPAHREQDASECPPEWGKDEDAREAFENALKQGIDAECVGEGTEGEFPRYIWGFFNGRLCIARLINRVQGWYKGWCLEDFEWPRDPGGKLERLQRECSNA